VNRRNTGALAKETGRGNLVLSKPSQKREGEVSLGRREGKIAIGTKKKINFVKKVAEKTFWEDV